MCFLVRPPNVLLRRSENGTETKTIGATDGVLHGACVGYITEKVLGTGRDIQVHCLSAAQAVGRGAATGDEAARTKKEQCGRSSCNAVVGSSQA